MDQAIEGIYQRIVERSRASREAYLSRMQAQREAYPPAKSLSCGNLAHAVAASDDTDKDNLGKVPNLGIVSAYNDVLSAHQPYGAYPQKLRQQARALGASTQVAGGVPAMCDGVTQGQPGMDLSLFSRDVIALGTAIALSHNVFDGVMCLGICDKIVPGLLMGALSFGHLPTIFVPSGPMASGLSNKEKHHVRQEYAAGKVDQSVLMQAEQASYHSPGTCTFYGTANSNQLLLEVMGLQLPGSAFVAPDSPLRDALNEQAVRTLLSNIESQRPLYELVTPASILNAMVALLATGGSTNHTMHWVAIARVAGIHINWQDFAELSAVVPLLARMYPNGQGDVNDFQAAGGTTVLMQALLHRGLLHESAETVMGPGLEDYLKAPVLLEKGLSWQRPVAGTRNPDVLRNAANPFEDTGGLVLLEGNIGRGIMKVSAVDPGHRKVSAPARVFDDQESVLAAFKAGELNQDCVVVVRFQGPRANGMPELHKLTPCLGVLQDRGLQVALVTDGRMSGASGKVPAAIHVYPEALDSEHSILARLQDGDPVTLDAAKGLLQVEVSAETLSARDAASWAGQHEQSTLGRDLFNGFRNRVSTPELGAISLELPE